MAADVLVLLLSAAVTDIYFVIMLPILIYDAYCFVGNTMGYLILTLGSRKIVFCLVPQPKQTPQLYLAYFVQIERGNVIRYGKRGHSLFVRAAVIAALCLVLGMVCTAD